MGYAPYEYDYIDYPDEERSYEVIQLEKRIDHASDHLQGLINQLTGLQDLNVNDIYFHLGEICGALGKDDEFGILTIARKTNILQFAGV